MTIKLITKEMLAKERATWRFADGIDLAEHLRKTSEPGMLAEFIGSDDFAVAWKTRQQFEVDAGRDEEPLLYTPLFAETRDPSLPEFVGFNRLGPAGVVFHEVTEGGEVKFMTVGSSTDSVQIRQWAVGLRYTKKLAIFNQLWSAAPIERQTGIAHNALLNELHLAPFLTADYAGASQTTSASAVGGTLAEKTLRTIEAAVKAASTKKSNPRRGPYYILCSTTNVFDIERALSLVSQDRPTAITNENALISSARSRIRGIIAYDGWDGQRGDLSVSYSGVADNEAYLIDVGRRASFHLSFVKQDLESESGNADVSRFIRMESIYDTWRGVYVAPLSSTQKFALPTS